MYRNSEPSLSGIWSVSKVCHLKNKRRGVTVKIKLSFLLFLEVIQPCICCLLLFSLMNIVIFFYDWDLYTFFILEFSSEHLIIKSRAFFIFHTLLNATLPCVCFQSCLGTIHSRYATNPEAFQPLLIICYFAEFNLNRLSHS